ncbi:hypothetical protein GCM10027074_19360 [Streptomyces deserti]
MRYADRLREAGSLVEHHDVRGADHGYDGSDDARAREVYGLTARSRSPAPCRRAGSPAAAVRARAAWPALRCSDGLPHGRTQEGCAMKLSGWTVPCPRTPPSAGPGHRPR